MDNEKDIEVTLIGATDGKTMPDEMANEEFLRICKAARVKWDLYRQIQGTRDADADRMLIVDEIQSGGITVNSEGFPTVHTESEAQPEIKIFRRPIRADKLMIDRVKEGHNMTAQNAVMGKFLNIAPAILESLDDVDFKKVEVLWYLFLGY